MFAAFLVDMFSAEVEDILFIGAAVVIWPLWIRQAGIANRLHMLWFHIKYSGGEDKNEWC